MIGFTIYIVHPYRSVAIHQCQKVKRRDSTTPDSTGSQFRLVSQTLMLQCFTHASAQSCQSVLVLFVFGESFQAELHMQKLSSLGIVIAGLSVKASQRPLRSFPQATSSLLLDSSILHLPLSIPLIAAVLLVSQAFAQMLLKLFLCCGVLVVQRAAVQMQGAVRNINVRRV